MLVIIGGGDLSLQISIYIEGPEQCSRGMKTGCNPSCVEKCWEWNRPSLASMSCATGSRSSESNVKD